MLDLTDEGCSRNRQLASRHFRNSFMQRPSILIRISCATGGHGSCILCMLAGEMLHVQVRKQHLAYQPKGFKVHSTPGGPWIAAMGVTESCSIRVLAARGRALVANGNHVVALLPLARYLLQTPLTSLQSSIHARSATSGRRHFDFWRRCLFRLRQTFLILC